jgi:alkylation response protein AidB-like acyl-CoA dehydrogenase
METLTQTPSIEAAHRYGPTDGADTLADLQLRAGRDLQEVEAIAAGWRAERPERQARCHLDRHDFDALREAGLWLSVVPEEMRGFWRGSERSTRPVCEALRRLAAADPSVALVSSMHPAVIAFWLANPDPSQPDWEAQRGAVFATAAAGDQWGTITSEPGSGGDIGRTRAVAVPANAPPFLPGRSYTVTGDKHFGSGLGITDWMITTAIPDGESEPAIFVLDVRDRPWDGSAGLQLTAEWDGMGMAATQSHAMRLENAPAVRFGHEERLEIIALAAAPITLSLFTAVTLGVLDEAIAVSGERLRPQADVLRAYERVEWSRAEQDHWVAEQAYEGALRALENGEAPAAVHAALRAKQAVADLAEDTLRRLCRIHGGGTFSRRSPFAHWFEDVRALGFLRPPWGLAYDMLFGTSLEQ